MTVCAFAAGATARACSDAPWRSRARPAGSRRCRGVAVMVLAQAADTRKPRPALADVPKAADDDRREPIAATKHRLSPWGEPVERAIREGVRFLKQQQHPDGSWPEIEKRPTRGRPAWSTLALLTAGEQPDSPTIRKALEFLRNFGPDESSQHLRDRVADHGLRRRRSGPRSASIAANVEWLERCPDQAGRPDGSGPGPWTYSENKMQAGDNSNTQYALLGLNAASEVGRRGRRRGLGAVPRTTSSDSRIATVAGRTHPFTAVDRQHDLAGDLQPDHHRARSGTQGRSTSRARRSGTAARAGSTGTCSRASTGWPAISRSSQNFGHGQVWKFYYLYGLERAGRLAGVRFFGKHDWYRVGAEELVHDQDQLSGFWQGRPDGERPDPATSFALLFLAKGRAARPDQQALPPTAQRLEQRPRRYAEHRRRRLPRLEDLLTWQVVDPGTATVPDLLQAPILFFNGHQLPSSPTRPGKRSASMSSRAASSSPTPAAARANSTRASGG